MSRSRKDKPGGHYHPLMPEVWSRRCRKVNMWSKTSRRAPRGGPNYKTITHRRERRQAKIQVRTEVSLMVGHA